MRARSLLFVFFLGCLVGCYQSHPGSTASCGGEICTDDEQCCPTCDAGPRCQSLDLPCPDVSSCEGCATHAECEPDQRCIFEAGTCGPRGFCFDALDCSGVGFIPVCGCDGRDYESDCEALNAGASIAFYGMCEMEGCGFGPPCGPGERCCDECFGDGFCVGADEPCPDIDCPGCFTSDECPPSQYCERPDGLCGEPGTCAPRPVGCDDDCPGVCGCDGDSYCNACNAAAAGVSVQHEGECDDERPCGFAGVICDEGEFCDAAECGALDLFFCSPIPEDCPTVDDPVCGCDGRTYGNACLANAAEVAVASRGPCDTARSCRDVLRADPSAPSGVYTIQPLPGRLFEVYCDMETDGGGWTLVSSSRRVAPDDAAGPWHPGLTAIRNGAVVETIWDGMRSVIVDQSDVRFTCGAQRDPRHLVDLSFYRVRWYREWTTGTDADSCFSEGNGRGYDRPAPSRRDNVSGAVIPQGVDWAAGFLEGEDSCDSPDDFTVDLRDRGMDSNQMDPTDWGRDDDQHKCGDSLRGEGAWQVWVREI